MPRLTPADARALAEEALSRWNASPEVAACVAEHLVDAELAGHPSHGLRRLPHYRDLALRGACDLRAIPAVLSRWGAVSLIDGGAGLGHPPLALAVDSAAEAAQAFGVGLAGVVRSGHAGRAGAWAERGVAKASVTLVVLAGSDPPFPMAAGPGASPALHTNPIAVGFPAHGDPLLLDIATSVVAEGKVMMALARCARLPDGAILDRDDHPSTNPADFYAGGSLLPTGGYKGFGLSATLEALAVSLTGADAEGLAPIDGALVACFKADAFRPTADVRASVEAIRSRLRASGRSIEVLAPGDPEARARRAGHVDVDDYLHEALVAVDPEETGGKENS